MSRRTRFALLSVVLLVGAGWGAGCGGGAVPEPDVTPAAAAPAEISEWRAMIDGAEKGPMTEGELRAEWIRGRIRATDLVWREGMTEWKPISIALGSIATGSADAAGRAFLELCSRAGAVPLEDRGAFSLFGTGEPDAPSAAQLRRTRERHGRLLEDARSGMRTTGNLDHDYEDGAMLLLPHLAPSRILAKLLAGSAKLHVAEGKHDLAAADCAAIARVAMQIAGDRVLISSLVSMACASLFASTSDKLGPSAGDLADMRAALAWIGSDDPFGIVDAIGTERSFALDYLAGEIRAGRMSQYIQIENLRGEDAQTLRRAASDLDANVIRCREAYDELIRLLSSRRVSLDAETKAFFHRVEVGDYGNIALVEVMHVERVLENVQPGLDKLDAVRQRFGG